MANDRDWKKIGNDKEKYAAYLCSREWGLLKEAVRERAGGLCERCSTLPIDATHHLTYARKYKEKLEDLEGICQPCHDFTHAKGNFDPKLNADFIRWLRLLDNAEAPWLTYDWKLLFPAEVFCYGTLVPVFQMWVSLQFQKLGAQAVAEVASDWRSADGNHLDDVIPPCDWEIEYTSDLPAAERAFWSWLCWNGPTQFPVGEREPFEKCLEVARRIRG